MQKEYLKYKKYAHFDKKMSIKKAKKILSNDEMIKNHGFFPFVHYTIKSKKLESVNGKVYAKREPKKREIYYCAHLDRYIYQQAAHSISDIYNNYVIENGIDDCVGAYRINKGKCNIDFAHEMFEFIKSKNNALVIVGDFTGFFDNLDHKNLKNRLMRVLNSELDNNLYKIFKSLTKFKYIDIDDLYEYYTIKNGRRSEKYYMRKLEQLMSIGEFRIFLKGKNKMTGERYLKENKNTFGIVQGSPMSGLLANIYMIDFDKKMNELALRYNGKYLRYSDDFIIVIESSNTIGYEDIYNSIQQFVKDAGQIELEKRKTNIYRYDKCQTKCINEEVFNTKNVSDNLNFLGFSFDGKQISIRSKTVSKYFYKMSRKIKQLLKGKKGITTRKIYESFSLQGENKKNARGNKGNFITYVKRAARKFEGESQIEILRKKSKTKVTEKIGAIKSKKTNIS